MFLFLFVSSSWWAVLLLSVVLAAFTLAAAFIWKLGWGQNIQVGLRGMSDSWRWLAVGQEALAFLQVASHPSGPLFLYWPLQQESSGFFTW